MKEEFKTLGGQFEIFVYDGDKLKSYSKVHNKMTNASLAAISGLIGNTGSQTAFTYLELGTGSTAVSAAHTTLVTAITDSGLARASATNSRKTTTQTNDTLSMTASWTATGSKTIEEIGIFNASSSGVMLARALTGAHALVNGNVVTAVYTLTAVGN